MVQVAPEARPQDDISLFDIAGTVVRHRRRVLLWMLIGAVLLVLPVLFRAPVYTAVASFVPQSSEAPPSGLRSLAGQFGVSLAGSSPAESPQFYADLLKSPVILGPITADRYEVPELDRGVHSFMALFRISASSPARRQELAVQELASRVAVSVERETGVLTVRVTTPWPSLSAGIAAKMVEGVNDFNLRTRQSQAGEERRFTEGRLNEAKIALRRSEDRLQGFLQSNRQYDNSPELLLQRDRLQRDVALQQQIVTSLSQAFEEARIREVRDIPVITVIEKPTVPTQPAPRGRVKRALLGMLLGGFGCIAFTFGSALLQRRRKAGDPHVEGFVNALSELREGTARLVRRRRGTIQA